MENMNNLDMEQKPIVYPSKRGQKWSEEEESLLLEELNSGLSADVIAGFHNRTPLGIQSRCGEIAYKMHLKGMSIEEIINQTKLDEENIKEWVKKKDYRNSKKIEKKEKAEKEKEESKDINIIENIDIIEMKNDIKDIKKSIEDIMDLISDLNSAIDNINCK
jgi:hydroxymethylpyrimidine pyrophosphatase-like HAD family hydrolase